MLKMAWDAGSRDLSLLYLILHSARPLPENVEFSPYASPQEA